MVRIARGIEQLYKIRCLVSCNFYNFSEVCKFLIGEIVIPFFIVIGTFFERGKEADCPKVLPIRFFRKSIELSNHLVIKILFIRLVKFPMIIYPRSYAINRLGIFGLCPRSVLRLWIEYGIKSNSQ